MSAITRTYTFSDGTDAFGSQVESEISNIVNTWNNHDAGSSRWTVVDAATLKTNGFTNIPILQIQTGTSTTAFTTTNSAFQTTNLTASITPKATTSKIAIFATGNFSTNVNGETCYASLYRGTTNLAAAAGFGRFDATTVEIDAVGTLFFIDSPSTTSSTTYSVKIAAASSTVGFGNVTNTTQYMALIELGT